MEMTLEGGIKRTGSHRTIAITSKDAAVARSFVYQFLARAFQCPDPNNWAWLNDSATHSRVWQAMQALGCEATHPLRKNAEEFALYLGAEEYESFYRGYLAVFLRGLCPLNEAAYLQPRADALRVAQRTSVLAGFYRDHGLVPTTRGGERIDHICFELEFMAAISAKEACVLGRDSDQARNCAETQTKFVRDHLSSWIPAFTRRLATVASQPAFIALALFTKAFLEHECERMEIRAHKRASRTLDLAAKG